MRIFMVLALVLAGCTFGGGKLVKPADRANPISANAINDDPIAVTSLDKPAADVAASPIIPPPSGPTSEPAKPAAEPVQPLAQPVAEDPAPALVPEELACLKTGGQWAVAGKAGGKTCVHIMRDAGKSCRKKSDCAGDCLARSNTCSPISPLFGCNEILQDNGVKVTLCID